ncbi:methyl-CpG-binding domain protein 5-like isoform X2 [Saccostrea echinata]|uniref:methyl-CpG-binding domain protein 5-like isoform X2 n=1 Tax=Saccostrea echinata TaxID=191078 RepID=UPI002A820008|nr:methyl-CpG-binding domain protein 5-like isoform X2 [Saccostrea echinata]
MDPSSGGQNAMSNDPSLYGQQTALASAGMYNQMMMGGYSANSGSGVEGLSVQCDMVNSQVNVLPSMGTFIGQPSYSNCLTMQGQQSPHIARLGMQNLSAYPNMAQNVCVPSNNTLPSFGHCFLTPSFNQQQTQLTQQVFNTNQDRMSGGFHVISNHMPSMAMTMSSTANPIYMSGTTFINNSAYVPKSSVTESASASIASSESKQIQSTSVYNVISSMPQKTFPQRQKSRESVEENVVSSTCATLTSPVVPVPPASEVLSQNQMDLTKTLHQNVNIKPSEGALQHIPPKGGVNKACDKIPEQEFIPKTDQTSSLKEDTAQVVVPLGWRREKKDGAIVYYSPSSVPLCSVEEITQYLLSDSTCKCGLECPVIVSKTFNFDISVDSKAWSLDMTKSSEDLMNLCNHRRKIINMATAFHGSMLTGVEDVGSSNLQGSKSTDKTKSKKKRSRAGSYSTPYDRVRVADLIAERDRLRSEEETLARQSNKESSDKPGMTNVGVQSPLDLAKSPPPNSSKAGLLSPTIPQTNPLQPRLQAVSDVSQFYPPHLSSMQSVGMLPNTYTQTIADAMNAARSSNVQLPNQSPAYYTTGSVHPQPMGNLPPLGSPPMGPHGFSMFSNTGFGLQHGYMDKRGNTSYPMPYTKPSMYRFTNPALSDLIDPASWTEKKKPRPKKPRAKKDKKKTTSVFESGTPPPNVDVSVLKDQGHGPIPKVKTSTPSSQFLDNPTGYLADQTSMIKTSLASSCQDSKENPSTSRVSGAFPKSSSSSFGSASDNLDVSTNVVVHTSQTERPDLSISITDTTMRALSMSDNTFTEDRCHSLSPSDSNGECPAETMMPTSIVHHTGKTEVPKVEIKVSDSIKTTEISGLATIPMQALSTVNSKQSDGTVLPNFSTIQQLLGYNMSNQFPASKMLSAAARAQMAQKTTVLPTELNSVQVTQQLLSSFQKTFMDKPGASVGLVASEQEALKLLAQNATLVSSTMSDILPVSHHSSSSAGGLKISASANPTLSVDSQIPSVMLQSGSQPQISTAISNVLTVLNNTQQTPQQILSSHNAPILSTQTTPIVSTQMVSQPLAVCSTQSVQITGSQSTMVHTQTAQIAGTQQTPIIYTQANSILTTQTTPIIHTQTTPIINTQATPIMNTQNSQFLSAVGNINQNAVMFPNPALNCAQNNSVFNPVMNSSSLMMPGNLTYTPDQCMPANFNLGGVGNQQIVGNNSNVCIKPLGQFINMDTNQIKQALPTQSCDLTQSNLPSGLPTTPGQLLVLPNLQMPLVQVFGSGQKNGAPDINSLLSQLQTNLAPMFNAQQVWNNLTTGSNLTAMQLQTLQLQQQLLQQIQQLQGMQSLISQFNAGDMTKVPAQFPMEVDRKDSNALSMVTMVNDVSTTTESPPLQSQENDEESNMEVGSEVTSTHVGNAESQNVDSTEGDESQNPDMEDKSTHIQMDMDSGTSPEKELDKDQETPETVMVIDDYTESTDTPYSNTEQENCSVTQGLSEEYEENSSQEYADESDSKIQSSTQTKMEIIQSKEIGCDTSSVRESFSKERIQHNKNEGNAEAESTLEKKSDVDTEKKTISTQEEKSNTSNDYMCVPDSSQAGENISKQSFVPPLVTSSTKHSKNTAESTSETPASKQEGDLIWGQIRGFPSWPGKVVPPCEVIDPEPLEMGKIWVKWYGDHTFTQVEQDKLKSLENGLKAHQRQKNRKGRKMNSNLEAAIQEALADLGQITDSNINSKGKTSKKKRVR